MMAILYLVLAQAVGIAVVNRFFKPHLPDRAGVLWPASYLVGTLLMTWTSYVVAAAGASIQFASVFFCAEI